MSADPRARISPATTMAISSATSSQSRDAPAVPPPYREHGVDDQFPHPERADGEEGAEKPEDRDGYRVTAVRLPDEPEKWGNVLERVDSLAPCRGRGGLPACQREISGMV